MPVPDSSMAGLQPPHMGPVAHGFAALGDAAERAVSTIAGFAADAALAPGRLGHTAALLTAEGRVGTLWQVMAPFAGLLLGAIAVALAVHRLLDPQRRALAVLQPSSAAPFALGLLRSLLVDTAPLSAYACLAAGGSFLLFWDRGFVFSGTETFQMVASLIISTSVVAWLLIVLLSLPLAVGRPGLRCVPLDGREAAAIRRFIGRIVALGAASWMIGVSLYLSWVGEGLPRLLLVLVGAPSRCEAPHALGRPRLVGASYGPSGCSSWRGALRCSCGGTCPMFRWANIGRLPSIGRICSMCSPAVLRSSMGFAALSAVACRGCPRPDKIVALRPSIID